MLAPAFSLGARFVRCASAGSARAQRPAEEPAMGQIRTLRLVRALALGLAALALAPAADAAGDKGAYEQARQKAASNYEVGEEAMRRDERQRQERLRRGGEGGADEDRRASRSPLPGHAEGARARQERDRRGRVQGRQGALRGTQRQRQGRLHQGREGGADPRRGRRQGRAQDRATRARTPPGTSAKPTTRWRPRSARRSPAMRRAACVAQAKTRYGL